MHTVVVRREIAEKHPDVVKAVYKGFCDVKQAMTDQFVKGMTFNNMAVMVPWLTKRIQEDQEVLGDDWWPLASVPTARRSTRSYAITTNRA